jgi:tRNA-2-methylthio-N6-dimethylallyladenosine synthase
VEGFNLATGQWIGRTAQNKTLNFVDPALPNPEEERTLVGQYLDVLVTRAGPNSLAGERSGSQPVRVQ